MRTRARFVSISCRCASFPDTVNRVARPRSNSECKMLLLEEYSELVERDSAEISFLWKGLQMLACLLSILTGYSCAILFYILWENIFGGHCPLWAKLDSLSRTVNSADEHLHDFTIVQLNDTDWKRYVVSYDYKKHCEFYFAACLLSCIFGTVWLTLFFMCGKGGYDVKTFTAPWRIVVPALLFNFCLTIITLYATYTMKKGYQQFSKDLILIFIKITKGYTSTLNLKYVYFSLYFFCYFKTVSWIMTWSWITGFMILFVRFITVSDFRLLKIRVFKILQEPIETQEEKEKQS
ncbi:uncharacterized protein [Linepithema humile]|uniref:uncharacterized protein n=1 Tax=Linepithema humile TaxID=83485 RepID=UPI00351EF383